MAISCCQISPKLDNNGVTRLSLKCARAQRKLHLNYFKINLLKFAADLTWFVGIWRGRDQLFSPNKIVAKRKNLFLMEPNHKIINKNRPMLVNKLFFMIHLKYPKSWKKLLNFFFLEIIFIVQIFWYSNFLALFFHVLGLWIVFFLSFLMSQRATWRLKFIWSSQCGKKKLISRFKVILKIKKKKCIYLIMGDQKMWWGQRTWKMMAIIVFKQRSDDQEINSRSSEPLIQVFSDFLISCSIHTAITTVSELLWLQVREKLNL